MEKLNIPRFENVEEHGVNISRARLSVIDLGTFHVHISNGRSVESFTSFLKSLMPFENLRVIRIRLAVGYRCDSSQDATKEMNDIEVALVSDDFVGFRESTILIEEVWCSFADGVSKEMEEELVKGLYLIFGAVGLCAPGFHVRSYKLMSKSFVNFQ